MATAIASLFLGTAASGTFLAAGSLITVTGPAAVGLAASGGLLSFIPASAGLFGAAGSLTLTGFLKGAFGLFSAFSDVSAGFENQGIEEINAAQAELQGLEEGNRITRLAIEQEALNSAATRSAGLTLQGSAGRVEEELRFNANRELSVSRSVARGRAFRFRARGRQAVRRGVAAGAGTLLKLI